MPAKLLPAYLIVGSDALKSREALTRLKGRLEPGMDVFNLDERTAGPDVEPGEFLASLNTLPIGSGFRLVVVHDAERLPKAVSEAIITYLKDPNPGCVLCLVATSMSSTTRLRKAVNSLDRKAVIDCTPAKRYKLPPIVQRMATKHGVSIDLGAANELISRVGESTSLLDRQVETLADICREKGVITMQDVEANVARTAEVKPWDLLDALSARSVTRSLELLALMPSTSGILICSLVTGRVRELICAKSFASTGRSASIAEELGKPAWQVRQHVSWSEKFAPGELEGALAACAACERALKSGGDEQTELIKLVMSLCAEKRQASTFIQDRTR